MKKSIIAKVMVVVFILCVAIIPQIDVFATGISTNFPASSGSIQKIDTSVKKIWGTVTTVVQILAFAAIVFAGLRYMFASADQKADIKKGLGMLTIGSILVFLASTVVQFVINAADEII